jgi:hypothetical protein
MSAEFGPPVLRIGGEKFGCVDFVPQWNLMRLAKKMQDEDPMAGMAAMFDFLKFVVLAEDWERFDAHMSTLDLEEADLDSAIGDLLVEMAGRGKGSGVPSGRSSDGSPETPATQRVVSLSRGTVEEIPADADPFEFIKERRERESSTA